MSLLSNIDIQINQKPLKSFQSLTINQNLYGIDSFTITCRYDAIEKLDGFLIENTKDFLGLPIVIQTKMKVKEEEKDGISFQGFVTEIESTRSGMADYDQVIISGGSSEIVLNRKPTNRAFFDKSLNEIAKEVLKSYQIKTKISTRNKDRFPYIVQFEESDLEFLKRLSIRYGEWFFFNGKELIFGEVPEVEGNLTIGYNLQDFKYELRVNPVKFSLYSVDPLKLDVYNYKSGKSKIESNLNTYGKHALKMSKQLYAEEGRDYYEHLNVDESEYKKGLDSVGETEEAVDAVNLTDISGSSTNGFLTAGMFAKINCPKQDGKSKISYGKYLLTSVQHNMDNTLTYQNNFAAIAAETTIPENTDPYFVRQSHNQLGLVADNKDPKKLGRVKISFWWMEGKQMTPWVKVLTPYTHKSAGFYFVPPKNSRVLVGFEDGDVEKPYCLGNLFDEDASPDAAWAGNYNDSDAKIHAIRTKRGQTIELHDEDGAEKIKIYDSQQNAYEVIFDTGNEEIQVKTTGKLRLEADEIEMKADQGITIKAGQKLEIEAQTDLSAKAGTAFKAEAGSEMELKASVTLKAEGSAQTEVSSSGITTIKGSMVQIN